MRQSNSESSPQVAADGGPVDAPAEPIDRDVERELSHDEFTPIGTAALLVVYALVVGLMWVFMYFVEFLGNGPTVIG